MSKNQNKNNSNKMILIIAGIAIVLAIVVLCIVLIPNGNSDTDTTNPTTSATDETQNTMPETEDNVMEEYEELKEKLKDIYTFTPSEPFKYSDDDKKDVYVKDITSTFDFFPSTQVENKEGNEILYKDEIYEMGQNVSKYDHLLLDDAKPVLDQDSNEWLFPYKDITFDLDLSNYKQKHDDFPDCYYTYMVYQNIKNMTLNSIQFETEAEYYQACYDVMLEFLRMLEGKDLKPYLASTVSYYSVSMMYEAIDAGNYDVLFDAIMNKKICMVYVDESGVYYKIEVTDKNTNHDGEAENCLNFVTIYTFDDEEKYLNPNPQ